MGRLEELEKQQEAIAAEEAKARGDVVQQVRALIKRHGITLSEVKIVLKMRKPRAKSGTSKALKARQTMQKAQKQLAQAQAV